MSTSNYMTNSGNYRLLKQNLLLLIVGVFLLALLTNLAFAHGMSEDEKQAIIDGGNWQYMWLGATHMLSGYDHLAFVFGIIFFLTSFKDIAKYVTAFTLGHSVTLIFATFNAIQLNYFLIDAVIALSVCYIAFANIDGFRKYLSINPPNMMLMIIGLGLIHGFGLSTRLQDLPLSQDALLLNIISFNIGIELGQISALFAMLVLITAWRKTQGFKAFSLIANYTLIFMGIFLFFMQMHGYEHTVNAEELSVSETPKPTSEGLADTSGMLMTESVTKWSDSIEITIPARGEKEYKLQLSKGASFAYSWKTESEALFFDFHGEPKGDTTGYFKSYQKGTGSRLSGSLVAPFEGTHGWYWKNGTRSAVSISLKVSGDYQIIQKSQKKELQAPKPEKTHRSIDSL